MDNLISNELIQTLTTMVGDLRKENEELRKANQDQAELMKQLNQTIANLNETVECRAAR